MNNLKLKTGIAIMAFLFALSVNAQGPKESRNKEKKQDVEKIFKKRDKNEDGKLSEKELIGLISNDFAKVDTDEDGFLTLEELKKAPRFNRKERGRKGRPNVDEMLSKMDIDEDGKLSKEEVKGPLAKRFSKIDANDDGYLTKEEIEKAPKPDRQGRNGRRGQGRQN